VEKRSAESTFIHGCRRMSSSVGRSDGSTERHRRIRSTTAGKGNRIMRSDIVPQPHDS